MNFLIEGRAALKAVGFNCISCFYFKKNIGISLACPFCSKGEKLTYEF